MYDYSFFVADGWLTRQQNVFPILTVGGWDGSIYFSSSMSSSNRTTFVQSIVSMVNKYGFQGVEFEYVYLI
jgi:chitinase